MISSATQDRLVKLIESSLPQGSVEVFLGPAKRDSRRQLKVNLYPQRTRVESRSAKQLTLNTTILILCEESIKTRGREEKSYLTDIGRDITTGLMADKTLNSTVVAVDLDSIDVRFSEELDGKYVMEYRVGMTHDIA